MIWNKDLLQKALGIYSEFDDTNYENIIFNSKEISFGDIFIAINSTNGGDGHEYINQAIKQGASLIIASDKNYLKNCSNYILVDDTREALRKLAAFKRSNSSAKFIGITGSSGKTTTKDFMHKSLSLYGKTYSTKGNFNNELGVDLTLASMPELCDYVIIEMGMDNKDEILELTKKIKPDIAIITTIGYAHIKNFATIDDIADAKCEIFAGLSENGLAILNKDISTFKRCEDNLSNFKIKNIKLFSSKEKTDGYIESYKKENQSRISICYDINNTKLNITTSAIPEYIAQNFITCLLTLDHLELDINKSRDVIQNYTITKGRGNIEEVKYKDKNLKLICDYYNANPDSMIASIKDFKNFRSGRKIMIIGDMGELGEYTKMLHNNLIPHIKNANADIILLLGKEMSEIYGNIKDNQEVYCFDSIKELLLRIDEFFTKDSLILLKASRFMGFEKIAKHLGVNNVL